MAFVKSLAENEYGPYLTVSRRSFNYNEYTGQSKCSTHVKQDFSPWTLHHSPEVQCNTNGNENSKKRDGTSYY